MLLFVLSLHFDFNKVKHKKTIFFSLTVYEKHWEVLLLLLLLLCMKNNRILLLI